MALAPLTPPSAPPEAQSADRSAELLSLAKELVTAFVVSCPTRLVMPEGRRADVIELLTRCVVDPVFTATYARELKSAVRSENAEADLMQCGLPDMPDDEFARHGFSTVEDVVLVDVAVSSIGLEGVAYSLCDRLLKGEEMGEWYADAMRRYHPALEAAYPGAWEQYTSRVEVVSSQGGTIDFRYKRP